MSIRQDFSLFEGEERVIQGVEEFLADTGCEGAFLKEVLRNLLEEYKKLYKSTKRLVRMSDKREHEIKKLSEEMVEKNRLLGILSSKLSRYLSPQLAETILSGKQDVTLQSTRKKLTVFFSDIVGFSEFADRLESEDLTEHLNYYLDEMTKIALAHGATIDKYIGDAIMIFFGDPTSLGVQQDAQRCVQMALEMKKRLKELRLEEGGRNYRFFTVRMGIHTGYCTVGNFGSEERMDYTIIGNAVNIASRLESSANPDEILISYDTFDLVREAFYCEERGEMRLKGLTHPILTYRVIEECTKMASQRHIFDTSIFGGGASIYIDANRMNQEELAQTIAHMEGILQKLKTCVQT